MSVIKDRKAAGLHYRVSLPCPLGKQQPWVLFLHGRGERGHSNGSELQLVQKHGPWHSLWSEHFVIIAPQCPRPKLWQNLMSEFVDLMCDRYPLDRQRGYCTGLSLGGFGCWTLASAAPYCFAAIAPICGGFCPYHVQEDGLKSFASLQRMAAEPLDVSTVSHIPTWIFHGKKKTTSCHQTNPLACTAHSQRQRTFLLALFD